VVASPSVLCVARRIAYSVVPVLAGNNVVWYCACTHCTHVLAGKEKRERENEEKKWKAKAKKKKKKNQQQRDSNHGQKANVVSVAEQQLINFLQWKYEILILYSREWKNAKLYSVSWHSQNRSGTLTARFDTSLPTLTTDESAR
jgi:flagellar biosynthesis component FlhA